MDRFIIPMSKVLGLMPFNHRQPIASCIDYILIMILPIAYISCFIAVYIYSGSLPQVLECHTICASGHYMFIHMGMFLFATSFIFNLPKRQFYSDFASAMDDIDGELLKCNSKIEAKTLKNRKYRIAILAIIAIFFNIGVIFDGYNMYLMIHNLFPLLAFTYAFPFMVGCTVQVQFISFINLIAEKFQRLNRILELICKECDEQKNFQFKLFDVETDFAQKSTVAQFQDEKKQIPKEPENKDTEEEKLLNSERFLVNVFKIHNKLCQAGVLANRAYALQIVCYMTVAFIIIVFGIFLETKVIFLVGGINKYLDYMAHSYGLWATTLSLVAYIVLRLCCQVQREAKRSALLVHEIMQRKPAFMLGNDIYYNRMKCFTLQYLHWENYFHFNGIGLFRLDYTFIFSAISAATSYLIVLLQFDLTSEITT